MVQQAIQQGGGDDGITEHLAPLGKAAVAGQDHGAAFVASVDQLKEQIAAAGHDREVANLIDDEQGEAAIEADLLAQNSLTLGLSQRADQIGQVEEMHTAAGFDGLDAKGDREVTFSMPGGPMKWTTSVRSINFSSASARIRLRSSEGWNAKSKPASVLMLESLAITSEVLMRRLSRSVNSSASMASIASSALTSPRSSWRTMTSTISNALGMRNPTRVALMRSTTDGMSSVRAFIMHCL